LRALRRKRYFARLDLENFFYSIGRNRVRHALRTLGIARSEHYASAWGRSSDPIPPAELRDILLSLGNTEAGLGVACDILYMRLHSDKEQGKGIAPELVETGRELLSRLRFKAKNDGENYRLRDLAKACLQGEEGFETARAISERFAHCGQQARDECHLL
jgi:hypothetical protein